MVQVLEALYIRPCARSDVFSLSRENCQLRNVDLSKMEEKRAVARKWSAWPGRGPGFAFILGQLAPVHYALLGKLVLGTMHMQLHHAPCTTGTIGTMHYPLLGQLAPCTMHHALLGQLAPRATCRSAIWNKLGGTTTASVHFLGPRFLSWSFPSILVINIFHCIAYW